MIFYQLTGLEAIDRKLVTLPERIQGKVARQAVRAGAKEFHGPAKAAAPSRSGDLERSLKVRAGKRSRRMAVSAQVVTEDGWFKGKTFYGGFVEYGTRKMPGLHFLKKTFDANVEKVKASTIQTIAEGVEREAANDA